MERTTSVLALAPSTGSQRVCVLARGGRVAECKQGKPVFCRLRRIPIAKIRAAGLDLVATRARRTTARAAARPA